MSSARPLPVNAALNAGRILLSALVTLLLYRFLLEALGEARLGLWSVILATAGAGGLGAGGLGSGILRHAGPAAVSGNRIALAELLHTAVITAAALLAPLLPLVGWLGPEVLTRLVPQELHPELREVFPLALAALACGTFAGLYQALLEGLQRYDLTSLVLLGGTAAYAGAAFLLVPSFGVTGLAAANILQWLLVLCALVILTVRSPSGVGLIPRRWSGAALRRLLGFGLRVQGMGLLAYAAEPLTKWLATAAGGLRATAYLDMAGRLIGILRQVVVGAAAPLVPAVADLAARAPGRMAAAYERSFRLLFVAAPPILLTPALMAGVIPALWIGRPEPLLTLALIVLSVAWCINAVSAPAYFFLLGAGRLTPLLAGHVVTAAGIILLGAPAGEIWGYPGVLGGYAAALSAGSLVALATVHRKSPALRATAPRLLGAAGIYAAAILAVSVSGLAPEEGTDAVTGAALPVLALALSSAAAVSLISGWKDLGGALRTLLRLRRTEEP